NMDKIRMALESRFDLENMPNDSDAPEWEQMKAEIENLNINFGNYFKEFKDNLDEEISATGDSLLPVSENNEAVKQLFGYAKDSQGDQDGLRGSVIMDDIYLPFNKNNE